MFKYKIYFLNKEGKKEPVFYSSKESAGYNAMLEYEKENKVSVANIFFIGEVVEEKKKKEKKVKK